MKISRYEGQECRLILTGMITDQVVCSRIASMKRNGEPLFNHPWADTVARWCTEYMRKYDTPPNGNIRQIFSDWAESEKADKETVEAIEKFLTLMSREYEKDSPKSSDFILDVASQYFNTSRLKHAIEEAGEEIRQGNWQLAQEMLANSPKLELGRGSTIVLDQDFESWRNAVECSSRGIVEYSGAIGKFFGDCLSRGSLYAFMGVDKSGKSFWLLDLVFRAIRQRRRVAFFEAGDMGEEDTIIRLAQRIEGKPEVPSTIFFPTAFDDEKNPIFEKRELEQFSVKNAFRKLQRYTNQSGKLRLSCHPNSSLSVRDISSRLKDWTRENWIPDVVVIDYADILAPPVGIRDTLDQIDETWKHLRRLSQEFHCLVVTATQTNAAAYQNNGFLSRKHFSGRKTKLAHVNGMIGLSVSNEDKTNGITRLNWVVRRRGRWNESKQLYVAGCLDIGRPSIISTW